MSSGNLNTSGGKKNNFSFQHNLLLINGAIQASVAGNATEATLQQVLTALQNGQDYEAKLVRDSDTPEVTWLEVRLFNQTTHVFDPPIYYLAGTNITGVPVAPVTYIDPTTLLSTIASNTTGLATQVTAAALLVELQSLNTPLTLTPTLVRRTDATGSPIVAGKRRIAFFNSGNADGVVLGAVIKPGESIDFGSSDLRDVIGAVSYDATGTELVISTLG